MIEKKGFDIAFQDAKVFIMPRGSSSKKPVLFGFRESNLYRLKGQHIQGMARSSAMTENREQATPNVEQFKESRPLGLARE